MSLRNMGRQAPNNKGLSHLIGTMGDLQQWVTERDEREYECMPEGMVCVTVTHNYLKKEMKELRLDLHMTILAVKEKLYTHCGTLPQWQALVLKSSFGGEVVCEMRDENRLLGYYGVATGMHIKIVDQNPHSLARGGGLEDVSQVKKYMMTDAEYGARDDNLWKFKEKKLKEDPTWSLFKNKPGGATKLAPVLAATEADVADIKVGQRCEVNPGKRRGAIGFVGEVIFAVGYWIGVILDEPLGRNNGTVKGKKYMVCADKCGIFTHPRNVTVGDFPEIDELATSSDEEL